MTPNQGPAGAQITISGSGFSTIPTNNNVKFNGTPAVVDTASATRLVTSVPLAATIGTLSVSVGVNSAVSPSPFLVTTLLIPDVAVDVNLVHAKQTEQFTFDGTTGQYVGLFLDKLATATTGSTLTLKVLNPDGTQLSNTDISANFFLNLPVLKQTGSYRVQVIANTADVVSAQLTLAFSSAELLIDGPSVTPGMTDVGQIIYLTFNGTAGQNLSLGLSNVLTNPKEGNISYAITKPDGSAYVSGSCSAPGCHQVMTGLPQNGIYTITVMPTASASTMNFTATLSTAVNAALTADTDYSLSLTRPGQIARLTFTGKADQYLGFYSKNMATLPLGDNAYFTLYNPDGSRNDTWTFTSSMASSLKNLAQTGTYLLVIETQYADTLQATVAFAYPGHCSAERFSNNH